MKSKKECEHCGKLMVEASYASEMSSNGTVLPENIVYSCENYENCLQFKEEGN